MTGKRMGSTMRKDEYRERLKKALDILLTQPYASNDEIAEDVGIFGEQIGRTRTVVQCLREMGKLR